MEVLAFYNNTLEVRVYRDIAGEDSIEKINLSNAVTIAASRKE